MVCAGGGVGCVFITFDIKLPDDTEPQKNEILYVKLTRIKLSVT